MFRTYSKRQKQRLASNNYLGALNILSQIDPSATCFNEAQSLAQNAEGKVNAEEKNNGIFK